MTAKPNDKWTFVCQTLNCDMYRLRDDLIAMIPFPDVRETEETALANLQAQADFWQERGHGGGAIIFMDPILEQDAGARAAYAKNAGKVGTQCFALIGESYFAMVSASLYTGISRPNAAIEVFRNLEEALPWIDAMLEKAKLL